jgi:hypothetical protein
MSYYAENKEKTLANAKENYMKNREKKISYAIEYQRKHSKKIYQRNKVALLEKIKEAPWITLGFRLRAGISSALRSVGSSKNQTKSMSIVGCTKEQLKTHIEKQFLPGMTWENRDKWHVDHITPISKATCEKEVIELYHFTNLRPIWASDNIRKSNKELFLI